MSIQDFEEIEINTKCKCLIKNVIENCKKEKDSNHLEIPLDDYEARVAYYTGLPKTIILKLIIDHEISESSIEIDYLSIIQCIRDIYVRKQKPNFKSIFQLLSCRQNSLEMADFQRYMTRMEYQYIKSPGEGYMLIEKPEITFERFCYLNKIVKSRKENRSIYYIGDRSIDVTALLNKESYNEGLVLFHMMSINGYECGLFYFKPTEKNFLKWIADIVIEKLQPTSTIIINDNSSFRQIEDTKITGYNSKSDMLKWLKDHNIPCNKNMHKAELFQLISKCSVTTKDINKIDEILKAHGHEVLHLPLTVENLSLTELIWKTVKTKLQIPAESNFNILELKQMIYETLTSIPVDTFQKYEQIIKDRETTILSYDQEIENAIEEYDLDTTVLYPLTFSCDDDSE